MRAKATNPARPVRNMTMDAGTGMGSTVRSSSTVWMLNPVALTKPPSSPPPRNSPFQGEGWAISPRNWKKMGNEPGPGG